MEFPTCPEGLARRKWVVEVFRIYRACQVDGVTLRDVVEDPTPVLVEALTLIHEQRQSVESRRMDLEIKKAKKKGASNAGRNR